MHFRLVVAEKLTWCSVQPGIWYVCAHSQIEMMCNSSISWLGQSRIGILSHLESDKCLSFLVIFSNTTNLDQGGVYCIKCVCQQISVELSEGFVLITKRIFPSTFVVDVFVGVSSFTVSTTRYFGSWKTVRSFSRLRVPLRVRESVRKTLINRDNQNLVLFLLYTYQDKNTDKFFCSLLKVEL